MTIVDPQILLYATVALLILVTLRSFFLKRTIRRETAALGKVNKQLEKAQEEINKLKVVEQRFHDFNSDLQQAELATKMQQTRKIYHQPTEELRPPEKYQYIHSLTQRGINASDIATILTISPQEADQLVNLASLAKE